MNSVKFWILFGVIGTLVFSSCDDDGFDFNIAECKPEEFLDNWSMEVIQPNIASNFLPQLNNADFTTTSVGYAVGELGTLIRISGDGAVWEVQLTGRETDALTVQALLSVDFFAEDQGFVGGSDILPQFSEERDSGAVFLSTVDAGMTWERRYVDEVRRFMDLEFYNPLLGLALSCPKVQAAIAITASPAQKMVAKPGRLRTAGRIWLPSFPAGQQPYFHPNEPPVPLFG